MSYSAATQVLAQSDSSFRSGTHRQSLSSADLALGLRLLADLLDAGLPLARALAVLGDVAPASWQKLLPHLQHSIREGKSLGSALRDAPVVIPGVVVGLTLAGETAGGLASAIRTAADERQAAAEMTAAIRSAIAYPALLAVAGVGAIGLMVGVVIPRFATILDDLGQNLPPATSFVLQASQVAREWWLLVLALSAALVLAGRIWRETPEGRLDMHRWLRRIPIIGSIRSAAGTARVAQTLASLLETGVALRHALPVAAQSSGDAAIEAEIRDASRRIESGDAPSKAMREAGALTPLAIKLMQAGEATGRLTVMLRHAARLEQQRGERLTRASVRMLEPGLILIFAGVVALVAAALLQAVYAVRPIQ